MVKLPASASFRVACALLLLGAAGGVAYDDAPPRPVVHRAGYRVVEADFHAHTSWSDGSLSPFGVVRQAARRGLDVVAITEHNTVIPSKMARLYAKATDGPLVVTGEEITSARFHVIAVGIERTVTPGARVEDALADVHAQGGVAIAAHPVRAYWPALVPAREFFDGAEIMHPVAYGQRDGAGWRWEDMVAFRQEASRPLAAIGSSDYHWGSVLGLCRTLLFVREPLTEAAVVEAIRERRAVTLDLSGHYIGEPELVRALEAEPLTPRTSDWSYAGASTGDRVLRAFGWLGVAAVVVLAGARRRREAAPVSERDVRLR